MAWSRQERQAKDARCGVEPTASGGVSACGQRDVSLASISRLTAAWSPQPALPHMVVTWMMDAVGGWPGGRETGTVGADMVGLVASGLLLSAVFRFVKWW